MATDQRRLLSDGALGAVETAALIRAGKLTAEAACEDAIARIERLDGSVNAVVVRDFARAREAASAVDATRSAADPRPLLGVPMTVKESFSVAGLQTTWGFPGFTDVPVTQDALAVARLKQAGAVILGKTNVALGLVDWQSENSVYGRTVNPYDHARSSGGSSGGSSAALALGMIPLELGSDIGGSIRIPAHMCGVFGHKPTYAVVPTAGHSLPESDGLPPPLAVIGPLARRAADLRAALQIIAGPASGPYTLTLPPSPVARLNQVRARFLLEQPRAAVDSDTRSVIEGLADGLSAAGAEVSWGARGLPNLDDLYRCYTTMLLTVTRRGLVGAEPINAHRWLDLLDEQMRITRTFEQFFSQVDVLIAPVFGVPAFPFQPAHLSNWSERTLDIDGHSAPFGDQLAWPGLATLPGLPATTVPVGWSRDGLPIGVQVISAPYADLTCIEVAEAMQDGALTLS